MSGTSVDAIDAALVSFDNEPNHHSKVHALYSHPIPTDLKKELLACNQAAHITLAKLCELQVTTGQIFAQAVQQLLAQENLPTNQVTAIGSHGQTIFHHPEIGMSLQVGHPAIIAKQTGITTVGDFRIDDMALGGQGAPFAPAFHQYLFTHLQHASIALNIGGIANISFLPAGNTPHLPLTGYDTGPGNGLMDEACQRLLGQPYDKDGALAASGKIHSSLLKALLSDNYFAKPAPKSTGRDYFNWQWLETIAQNMDLSLEQIAVQDLLATLTELTARSISKAITATIQQHHNPVVRELWVCGGGAFNHNLLLRLQQHLPNIAVYTSTEKQISPVAIEAMLFAWLAKQRLEHRPVNLKDVTGASRNTILGGVWQA